jgi:hypothetical protein
MTSELDFVLTDHIDQSHNIIDRQMISVHSPICSRITIRTIHSYSHEVRQPGLRERRAHPYDPEKTARASRMRDIRWDRWDGAQLPSRAPHEARPGAYSNPCQRAGDNPGGAPAGAAGRLLSGVAVARLTQPQPLPRGLRRRLQEAKLAQYLDDDALHLGLAPHGVDVAPEQVRGHLRHHPRPHAALLMRPLAVRSRAIPLRPPPLRRREGAPAISAARTAAAGSSRFSSVTQIRLCHAGGRPTSTSTKVT